MEDTSSRHSLGILRDAYFIVCFRELWEPVGTEVGDANFAELVGAEGEAEADDNFADPSVGFEVVPEAEVDDANFAELIGADAVAEAELGLDDDFGGCIELLGAACAGPGDAEEEDKVSEATSSVASVF